MSPADELTLTTVAPANGGSCIARHEGRVVFVRYALPGETVRARLVGDRGSYWNAEVVEVLDAADGRIDPLCPIAGPDGAGCCDLAFAEPSAVRRIKGAVVANQLARVGNYHWRDESEATAEPVGDQGATGWRTRVRLAASADGRAGFHRYHSAELVHRLDCAQLPAGMLDGVAEAEWPAESEIHVVLDDDGRRHIAVAGAKGEKGEKGGNRTSAAGGGNRTSAAGGGNRTSAAGGGNRTRVVEGDYETTQRVGARSWRVPATAFWQAHRDAPALYSALVAEWARLEPGMSAWDLYGGAGVFAAALAEGVGEHGSVLTVDTSRGASRAARAALADLGNVSVVTDSVRRALAGQRRRADVAVLDPPRAGAGREVIDLLAAAEVPRIIHIGCEAASFARDVGLYRDRGYQVEHVAVYDSFPLTHHVECLAVLQRPPGST
ncbi:tRNA/tmRNA/rRNA uracil-C5-methylase (TrmA/RlmC/RlmD family) [Mycolicibacterium iranicum]|uniref:tRNA/tmRNA/rRNA uracil-C5-methylase (TrmA/RlmC/RlmD family) n=1 Tax=Mycolicibacterium iranicum TaxID=912594 RepID=A0A839Q2V6_MYCIR|nr:class I SAM-dependent RNA methyltransferase [Mycolicibacterium iranicum]MBB2990219.1 tRNA/tmRNA/rRNA uracil-C5-methylase (TrmA/RlmC/RlmD family) [Mycolicibacterium iranicum]